MSKLVFSVLVILPCLANARPITELMLPMTLMEAGGNQVSVSDGDYGVLIVSYDLDSNDHVPLISFKSFTYEMRDGNCYVRTSDLENMELKGSRVRIRGKESITATEWVDPYDDITYAHSYVLTDVSKEGTHKFEDFRYRLEVSRYWHDDKREPYTWVYESGVPILDSQISPCVGKLNY